jgi:hypothetical protein
MGKAHRSDPVKQSLLSSVALNHADEVRISTYRFLNSLMGELRSK